MDYQAAVVLKCFFFVPQSRNNLSTLLYCQRSAGNIKKQLVVLLNILENTV